MRCVFFGVLIFFCFFWVFLYGFCMVFGVFDGFWAKNTFLGIFQWFLTLGRSCICQKRSK